RGKPAGSPLKTTDFRPPTLLSTSDSRLQTLSPLGRSYRSRRRLAGLQVEAAPLGQDVGFNAPHADRIVGLGDAHRGKFDFCWVHDRDGPAPDHFDHVVRTD